MTHSISSVRKPSLISWAAVLLSPWLWLAGCTPHSVAPNPFLTAELPTSRPIVFMPQWVPHDMLLHSGIFSPDLSEFYFTVSDKHYRRFDVRRSEKRDGAWSDPEPAFFNSTYNEHGTSFSPDGKTLYFSSTRPTGREDVADTWHLWRSEHIDGQWTTPVFVDIPNLRDRLVSHAVSDADGTLFFHAGTLDYSELDIYSSKLIDSEYQEAVKLPDTINTTGMECTPFIAPDGSYLLFERVPDLYISFLDQRGRWQPARPLSTAINTDGRGNPYVTPDERFCVFAAGKEPTPDEVANWSIYWVSTEEVLKNRPGR